MSETFARFRVARVAVCLLACLLLAVPAPLQAQSLGGLGGLLVSDPGPRGGHADAGTPFAGLTADERRFFNTAAGTFAEVDGVDEGLGPRFNMDSCAGCHAQPASGGSAPAVNPQVAVATKAGAHNTVPSFITPDGPVREVRFKSDGG